MSTPYDDETVPAVEPSGLSCRTCGQPLTASDDDAFDEEATAEAEEAGGFCPDCGQRRFDPAI
jgi:hypothetical protein